MEVIFKTIFSKTNKTRNSRKSCNALYLQISLMLNLIEDRDPDTLPFDLL